MSGAVTWVLPSLILLFCLVLAALAALAIYVACYRCRFNRAISTAPPSSAGDCERGLFSPAWNTRGVGVPSQELLLYQLCMKDKDGRKTGGGLEGVLEDQDGKRHSTDAAPIKDASQAQPKAAIKKTHISDDTKAPARVPPAPIRTGEGEKSPAVETFREKYATKFLSPTREALLRPKDINSNGGVRQPPCMTKSAGDVDDGEDIDAFYTPPESPTRSHARIPPRPEPEPRLATAGRGRGRGCGTERSRPPGMTPVRLLDGL